MARTPIETEDTPDPRVDKGFDKRIIYVVIAAGIVFVLLFLFLSGRYFSPDNTSGGGMSSQPSTQPAR